MTQRKWIIDKNWRECWTCGGRCDVKVNIETNEATSTCRQCKRIRAYDLRRFYDHRKCGRCSHRRRVTVTVYRMHASLGRPPEKLAEEFCDACKLILAAMKHERQAKELREKAMQIYRKRQGQQP